MLVRVKQKKVNLKSFNSKTTKNLLSKYSNYCKQIAKKRWDENNSKMLILSATKQLFPLLVGLDILWLGGRWYLAEMTVGPLPMLSTEWVHEKTKDRLMRLCLQVFTRKK
jgi:hypothetical protein